MNDINKNKAKIFANLKRSVNSRKFIAKAENYIKQHKLDWTIVETNEHDYISKIKNEVDNNLQMIIIAGGDGTVSAAAAIVAGSQSAMGIIPMGTGNDFARSLGIPNDIIKAMDIIRNGNVHECDMGKFNGKLFINVAGAGFDAEVLIASQRFKKKYIPRSLAYVMGTVYAAFSMKCIPAEVEILDANDQIIKLEESVLLMCFGNASYIGGGMKIAPEAKIDDGLLDICLVKNVSKLKFFSIFPKVFKGKHIAAKYEKYIYYSKFKSLKIKMIDDVYYQLDGDVYPKTNIFEIKAIADEIRLIF